MLKWKNAVRLSVCLYFTFVLINLQRTKQWQFLEILNSQSLWGFTLWLAINWLLLFCRNTYALNHEVGGQWDFNFIDIKFLWQTKIQIINFIFCGFFRLTDISSKRQSLAETWRTGFNFRRVRQTNKFIEFTDIYWN